MTCDYCTKEWKTAWQERYGRGFARRETGKQKFACKDHAKELEADIRRLLDAAPPYTTWNMFWYEAPESLAQQALRYRKHPA